MKEKEALDKLGPIPTTDEICNFVKNLYKKGYLIVSPEELDKINSITVLAGVHGMNPFKPK